MASIQCAIELYDGVSPVLGDMALALDSLAGRFSQFDAEVGGLGADVEGLNAFGAALNTLAAGADVACDALFGALAAAGELGEVFSAQVFSPLIEGAELAVAAIEGIGLAGEVCGAGLAHPFNLAAVAISADFVTMRGEIEGTLSGLGLFIAGFAAGLPGYFSGPLNQISGMFAAMAASAVASLASITASAGGRDDADGRHGYRPSGPAGARRVYRRACWDRGRRPGEYYGQQREPHLL